MSQEKTSQIADLEYAIAELTTITEEQAFELGRLQAKNKVMEEALRYIRYEALTFADIYERIDAALAQLNKKPEDSNHEG